MEEGNLSVQIAALRKLLGQSTEGGEWITTVPRVGYRFARTPHPEEGGDALGEEDGAHSRRPSIAVMPFANVNGERDQDYFADGITEDIITALGSYRWFFVIARNSSFAYKNSSIDSKRIAGELGVRYLLEGSVRKSGDSVRISARLIDAATSAQIWVERYDLAMTEVFAIQDEIAERVAGAIEPELLKTESSPTSARHTGNMTAWDLVRQGAWRFHQVTRPTHVEARELFREACRLDPRLPEAHIWRARLSVGLIAYGWSDDPAADRQEGLEAALRAIYLDAKNPYAHYVFASACNFSNRLEQAILAAERGNRTQAQLCAGPLLTRSRAPVQRAGFRGNHALSARTETESIRSAEPCLVEFPGRGAVLCRRSGKRTGDFGSRAGDSTGLEAYRRDRRLLLCGDR